MFQQKILSLIASYIANDLGHVCANAGTIENLELATPWSPRLPYAVATRKRRLLLPITRHPRLGQAFGARQIHLGHGMHCMIHHSDAKANCKKIDMIGE